MNLHPFFHKHKYIISSLYNAISFSALGRKPSWVSGLAQALLEKEDANILVVDWLSGASYAYNQVVDNYKEVAVQISILIKQLTVSVLYNISII